LKRDYNEQLEKAETELAQLGDERSDIHDLLEKGMGIVFRLHEIYTTGNTEQKRAVIGSISRKVQI